LDLLHDCRVSSGQDEARSSVKLWRITAEALAKCHAPPIYPLVDAVDEAYPAESDEILNGLADLASQSPNLKILVTSRPEEDIFDRFSRYCDLNTSRVPAITVPKAVSNGDISIYVKARLKQSRKLSNAKILKELEEKLLERADGMFIYVRMMLDELETESTVAGVKQQVVKFSKVPQRVLRRSSRPLGPHYRE
jgi:hypothetical protein